MDIQLLYDTITFIIRFFFSALIPSIVVYSSIVFFRRLANV